MQDFTPNIVQIDIFVVLIFELFDRTFARYWHDWTRVRGLNRTGHNIDTVARIQDLSFRDST